MNNDKNTLEQFMCSFCGNNYSRPNVLLGLDNSIICENCIELYHDIINFGQEEEKDTCTCLVRVCHLPIMNATDD